MTDVLSKDARKQALVMLEGWSEAEDETAIRKEYNFSTFIEAFGFMSRAAMRAEEMNHHPDWTNNYTRVDVKLSTHDAGGVTQKDITLASEMDRMAVETA